MELTRDWFDQMKWRILNLQEGECHPAFFRLRDDWATICWRRARAVEPVTDRDYEIQNMLSLFVP